MVGSLREFEDSTAFELWVLEGLTPLPATRPHIRTKEVDSNHVRAFAAGAVVIGTVPSLREVRIDLRPLAFGTAWKVLDLLVELAISSTGERAGDWLSIAAKVRMVEDGVPLCEPLDSDAWARLTKLYSSTVEVRHSLVHRRADVDVDTGRLVGRNRAGDPRPPISAVEQESFGRAVLRSAHAVIGGVLSDRARSDLAWNLDQLVGHHGLPLLGGVEMVPAPLAIVEEVHVVHGTLRVDVPWLLSELRASYSDAGAFDASFQLPDGRHIIAELETAPDDVVSVKLDNLPNWMTFWGGPQETK